MDKYHTDQMRDEMLHTAGVIVWMWLALLLAVACIVLALVAEAVA